MTTPCCRRLRAGWTSRSLPPAAGRVLLVAGTRDTYCPVDALHRLAESAGAEERIIEGADHFFFGKLYPLGEAIGAWVAGLPRPP